jgi:NTP pyrophosphatase (non-canonical NTP hydrolase)
MQVDTLQLESEVWFTSTFNRSPTDPKQLMDRANRFFEEALELYQAVGTSKEAALQLVEYVYARPVGEVRQEIGGAILTLSLLASAAGLTLDDTWAQAINDGYRRQEKIRAKDKAKRAGNPLPGDVDSH